MESSMEDAETLRSDSVEGAKPSLHEFRAQHADEYLEPMSRPTSIEPFRDPEGTAGYVNPDLNDGGEAYRHNCADCSRAFENTWRGQREEAAGRSYDVVPGVGLTAGGELSERTEQWAGEPFTPLSNIDDVRTEVERAGPGSSAIVHTEFEGMDGHRGGHAFNVVNFEGKVEVVDSQVSRVYEWNPGTGHPDMARVSETRTMVWDSRGGRVL
jgi:Papain fold toxin 1, glutamine deamidase